MQRDSLNYQTYYPNYKKPIRTTVSETYDFIYTALNNYFQLYVDSEDLQMNILIMGTNNSYQNYISNSNSYEEDIIVNPNVTPFFVPANKIITVTLKMDMRSQGPFTGVNITIFFSLFTRDHTDDPDAPYSELDYEGIEYFITSNNYVEASYDGILYSFLVEEDTDFLFAFIAYPNTPDDINTIMIITDGSTVTAKLS